MYNCFFSYYIQYVYNFFFLITYTVLTNVFWMSCNRQWLDGVTDQVNQDRVDLEVEVRHPAGQTIEGEYMFDVHHRQVAIAIHLQFLAAEIRTQQTWLRITMRIGILTYYRCLISMVVLLVPKHNAGRTGGRTQYRQLCLVMTYFTR